MASVTASRFAWLAGSRRRAALIVLGTLALLDAGRSLVARVAYAQPTERWQPDARIYADISWPPGAGLPAATPLGARVYAKHCAVCHGPDGRGNGPAAPSLLPRPSDFTLGQFKYKSTAAGSAPTDADLGKVVADGLPASSMPYWRDVLNDDEIRAVVAYVKSFSNVFGKSPPDRLVIGARLPPSVASIARGRRAYEERGCMGCHGLSGRGGVRLDDAKGQPLLSRDLSAPWTFRGGSSPEQVWLRVSVGLAPGPMPPLPAEVTQQERWDLVNYVLSLARTPPWQRGGKFAGPGFSDDLTRRGEYLVHAEICGLCHTMVSATGIYRGDDRYLGGGMRVGAYPHGMLVSRNLTSDAETGLGRWSDARIAAALRDGRSGSRVLNVFTMPWVYFHAMADDDATAVSRYLKALPPVRSRIPEPLRYGFVETLAAKLMRALRLAPASVLTYADQGFGSSDDGGAWRLTAAGIQQALVAAQWLVLVLVVGAFVAAGPRQRPLPESARGRIAVVAVAVLVGLAGLAAAVIYDLPQLAVIPPQQMAAGATATIFKAERGALGSDEQAALAERGRYLFTIGSCALCHLNDGSGGLKLSWKPMGTVWTRNLTPDRDTGIGAWSDAEIERAIRSGVGRNGQAQHWQAMPWDHASNWDEEDVRALVAYLRVLPQAHKQIPPDRAPAADDCDVYTFWTSTSRSAGCED
jgi:mono/diheme cytochrome c family protein